MAKAGTANTDAETAKEESGTGVTEAVAKAADDKATTVDGDSKTADPPAVKSFSQADMDRAVEKAQKEAQKQAAAAEAKAKLSEDERKDSEISELKNSIRLRDAKDSVTEALVKAGAKSPSLLFSSVRDQLEFDDKGKLTNLDSLLKDMSADFPEQFGTAKPDETIDGGAGQGKKGAKLTKEALARMTPAEIKELDWAEVSKVMAEK